MAPAILVGLAIIAAVVSAVVSAHAPLALLGLVFLGLLVRANSYETECPQCHNVFTAVRDVSDASSLPLLKFSWPAAFLPLAVCAVVGVLTWFFANPLILLALVFVGVVRWSDLITATCPLCNCVFSATGCFDDDDDDDDDDD